MKYTIVIFTKTTDQMKRTFASRDEANDWALDILQKLGSSFYARFL